MQENYKDYTTEELVSLYQSSKEEEYLQEILIRNKGLFYMWIGKYKNIPHLDADDLLEELYVACWRAVEAFDHNRGVVFTTCLKGFAFQSLNRLYNEATRQKRYTGKPSESYEELVELNLEGISDSSFSIECKEFSEIEIISFLESMEDTVKEVAIMLYNGMTKGEVAKALNCTPATISYYIKRLRQSYTEHFGGVAL